MSEEALPRRKFLLGAGLPGTAVATGLTQSTAAGAETPDAAANAPPPLQPQSRLFFN
jgi:hypothetical protein